MRLEWLKRAGFVLAHEARVTFHVGSEYDCETALHQRSPRRKNTALAAQMLRDGANARNVGYWHEADLRLAAPQGPLTVPLPTFGAECRFIGAFQTLGWHAAKVGS